MELEPGEVLGDGHGGRVVKLGELPCGGTWGLPVPSFEVLTRKFDPKAEGGQKLTVLSEAFEAHKKWAKSLEG